MQSWLKASSFLAAAIWPSALIIGCYCKQSLTSSAGGSLPPKKGLILGEEKDLIL
jgi:hypothetical protein